MSESREKEIDYLMNDLGSNFRREWFLTERGEKVEGVLLDADECRLSAAAEEKTKPLAV
jgi:hypothetical protein